MGKWLFIVVCALFICLPAPGRAEAEGFILMASTIGPIDSGIVDALENQFEKETGIRVRHVGAGTGAAIKIGEQCNVDLVLVHAKALEEKFVAAGFGTGRIPLMYNDFVIVGPASDPAGIKGMKSATEALKAISAKTAPFISRGDKSGTHVAEMDLWAKTGINPSGAWYTVYEKGSEGNVPTLLFTDQKGSYTVIDRATYLTVKDKIKLAILVEGDEALLNHISLIPVNPTKCPRVYNKEALAFVKWLTDPDKGQRIIESFGKDKYGQPLFFPESDEYKAKNKKQ
jgi:tungstate transport system substrate-binding protein